MRKKRIDLFVQLLDTHKPQGYGIGFKPNFPSMFWPDEECNTFDEMASWKNDLRKEQTGRIDFDGHWGMGTSFKKKMNIELLLLAFCNVSGEYFDKEETHANKILPQQRPQTMVLPLNRSHLCHSKRNLG